VTRTDVLLGFKPYKSRFFRQEGRIWDLPFRLWSSVSLPTPFVNRFQLRWWYIVSPR